MARTLVDTILTALAGVSFVCLCSDSSQADPVRFEFTLAESTAVQVGQRLSDGTIIAQTFDDTDNDRLLRFTADLDPSRGTYFCDQGDYFCWEPRLLQFPGPWPHLGLNEGQDGSLVIFVDGAAPPPSFVLGQSFSFINGVSPGLPGVLIRTNLPGIDSVEELVLEDPTTFPLFTGEAEVQALATITIVPEPASLLLLGMGILALAARRRPRHS